MCACAPAARRNQIADEGIARTRAYTTEMAEFRQKIARENADRTPVSLERIGLELESALAKDTCYVCDVDSGKTIDPQLSFGGVDKQYIGTGPNALGWGWAAACGPTPSGPSLRVVARSRA